MRHENSSLDAVIPVLRQLILAEILVRSAGKPQYRVELARRLGVPASSLQRPLAAMVRAGILTAVNQGREVLYGVNRESPLIPELESLVRKTRGLADVVRGSLRPLRNRIRVAFIYGSMATGSEGPSSDVDLFVIGQATLGELSRSLASAEQMLQREVNAIVRTPEEFIARLGARNHFVRSVLDKPKLFIVGTKDELARIAGETSGGTASDEQGRTQRSSSRRRKESSRRES